MGFASTIWHRHAGKLALASATFLAGCVSTPAPIDKVANSQALSACTIAGLKPILRIPFARAQELEESRKLLPGTAEEFAVLMAEDILIRGTGMAPIVETCIYQIIKNPVENRPSPSDAKAFTAFAARYFDADEFERKTLGEFPALMNGVIDEAIKRRTQRGITAPSDFLKPRAYK